MTGTHTVTRDYRSVFRSRPIAFSEGDTVDVDDETAGWVNNDSPGCLVPVENPAPVEKPKRNASHDAWVAFAVAQGTDPAEAAELSRDELAEMFGT